MEWSCLLNRVLPTYCIMFGFSKYSTATYRVQNVFESTHDPFDLYPILQEKYPQVIRYFSWVFLWVGPNGLKSMHGGESFIALNIIQHFFWLILYPVPKESWPVVRSVVAKGDCCFLLFPTSRGAFSSPQFWGSLCHVYGGCQEEIAMIYVLSFRSNNTHATVHKAVTKCVRTGIVHWCI